MIHTKADIKFHSVGLGASVPAINVKVHHLPDEQEIAKRLGIPIEDARRELELEIDLISCGFWNHTLPELVKQKLIPRFPGANGFSEGRSAGWVAVSGIGVQWEVLEGWDAVDLAYWRSFEKAIVDVVKEFSSANSIAYGIGARLGLCKHCLSKETAYHQYVDRGRVYCSDCGEWQ